MRGTSTRQFLVLYLTLAACGGGASEPDPVLQVAGAGESPGSSLGIALADGQSEKLAVELALGSTGTVNGTKSPTSAIAPLTFSIKATETDSDDRAVRVKLEVVELAVGDVPADASEKAKVAYARVHRAAARMPKLGGLLVASPTGFVRKLELNAEKAVSNQQRQLIELIRGTIERLLIPRPADAVGTAAKWSTSYPAISNGFEVERAVSASLEASGSIRLEVTEKLNDDGAGTASPAGVYADTIAIEEFDNSGTGEVKLTASQLFPTSAYIELRGHTKLKIDQAGQTDTVESKASLTIKAKSESSR